MPTDQIIPTVSPSIDQAKPMYFLAGFGTTFMTTAATISHLDAWSVTKLIIGSLTGGVVALKAYMETSKDSIAKIAAARVQGASEGSVVVDQIAQGVPHIGVPWPTQINGNGYAAPAPSATEPPSHVTVLPGAPAPVNGKVSTPLGDIRATIVPKPLINGPGVPMDQGVSIHQS